MKNLLLIGTIGSLLIAGCSTYKAARTPDDVYYSPAKPIVERPDDVYGDYSNADDNYLRMKVRNRYQWDAIDDYSYWNDSRYDFGYSCFPSRSVLLNPYVGVGFYSPYYYSPWATWYNPIYTLVYYKAPRVYYGTTSKTNLTAYRNNSYYNSGGRQTFGSLLKGAFSNNNYNNSQNTYNNTNPSRTFTPGNNTPSNSAGGRSGGFNSSGSSAGSPRPPR